jgi:hypothetical protein
MCGIFVFGWSEDRAETIGIRATHALLQLASTPQTIDLSVQRPGLEVAVHLNARPRHHWPFCTDVLESPPAPLKYSGAQRAVA